MATMALGLCACSCAVQPEPKESWVELPKSRVLEPAPAVRKDSALVSAQRVIDRDRSSMEPERVGVSTLSSWLHSPHLQIWDLTPEKISTSYEPLPKAIKVDPQQAGASLKGFKGTVVLVGHRDGRDEVYGAWRQLKSARGLTVMVLDGGIEAWSRFLEGR